MNRSRRMDNSANRNRNNPNNSQLEMSIDHEYLNQVDAMERQNKNFQIEIERIKAQKDNETQKVMLYQREMEQLHDRIQELEQAN